MLVQGRACVPGTDVPGFPVSRFAAGAMAFSTFFRARARDTDSNGLSLSKSACRQPPGSRATYRCRIRTLLRSPPSKLPIHQLGWVSAVGVGHEHNEKQCQQV